MTPPTEFPETTAALYDLLQERFGIGQFDEVASPQPPWWQARVHEITKLKAQIKSRRVTERQVAIAAWYATETGARVHWVSDLFKLIPTAMRAYNGALAEVKRKNALTDLALAIQEALDAGEEEWANRLFRAEPTQADALIEEWRNR